MKKRSIKNKIFKIFQSIIILAFIITGHISVFAQGNPNSNPTLPTGQTILEFNVTDQNGNANTQTNNVPLEDNPENNTPVNNNQNSRDTYKLLAPLSSSLTIFDAKKECAFGVYLNLMIRVFLGVCAILAMVMIVLGGIQYVGSELISSKEAGRERITHAVLGLLLALGAWLILNEINPKLLNPCLDSQLPAAQIDIVEGDANAAAFVALGDNALEKFGVDCPGSGGVAALPQIARSFQGKVTYSQSKRGTYDNNTIYLDCSSFVAQVYQCAGLSLPGNSTSTMFPNSEYVNQRTPTTANGIDIEPGDVLGWMAGEGTNSQGHAFMYLGGGMFIEVTSAGGTSGPNGAVRIRPMPYLNRFYHIIRANQI